ncbi:MAG: hypothetical protein GEU99_19345 [Luteitalea sp.]|nr:hypothetical protein [Luteitalea sp.]
MQRKKLQWLMVGSLALVPGPITAQSGVVVLGTPCRLVDTRGTGERTGILEPDSDRFFSLSEEGLTAGQGGDTECTGLPTGGGNTNWLVNITVTGFSANGALTVWSHGFSQPNTSVINYSAGHEPSVANGLILKGCVDLCVPGCTACFGRDIYVKALGSPTHVIIDVMGYLP